MAYNTLAAIADATKGFATDLISGAYFSRVKMAFGVEGSATDVSASNPLPVTLGLTDAQLRATALPVSFAGQSVGVTGTVSVTGTFWQATQPVSIASPVAVTGTFFQTTQPVSAAALPLPSGAATSAAQTTGNASLASLDGKFAALESGRSPIANDKLGTTTRVPLWATGLHLVIGAATARVGPLTGTEVVISPSTDCYVRIGDVTVDATAGAGSLFLAAGSGPHYFQMTTGSYIAAIRVTADGIASVIPVA